MTANPDKKYPQRTAQQNKALHVYFGLIADRLSAAGYDLNQVLAKNPVAVPCTPYNIKELFWKPIMKAQLGKESTTEMDTADIDKIYETVNRFLAQEFGISEPWPSIEEIINKLRDK